MPTGSDGRIGHAPCRSLIFAQDPDSDQKQQQRIICTELKNKMAVIPHPPYSPDLAPCDFSCFQKLN